MATRLGFINGVLTVPEVATPTALADHGKIYAKNTNKIFFQDGAGVEHELAFAGVPGAHTHDTDTLEHDGVDSDGGAFSFTTTGLVTFNQSIASANYTAANLLTACGTNAGTLDFTASGKTLDVEDNSIVDQDLTTDALAVAFGSLILGGGGATPTEFSIDGTLAGNSDLAIPTEKAVKTYVDGVVVGAHDHDTDTLQHDGVNSNGGAFSFTTTGVVTFNQAIASAGITLTGDITTTAGAIDWDLLDNNASALSFDAAGQNGIISIVTLNAAEGVNMSGFCAVTGAITGASCKLGGVGATPTEFSTDGTMAGNSNTAIPTEAAVVTYVTAAVAAKDTFLELTDTPGAYTTDGAIYVADNTGGTIEESTVILTEAANTFNITKGTAILDIAAGSTLNVDANLTVETASIVNQDLTTDASPTFAGVTLTADIDTDADALDWDLLDNNASALSFDVAGKANMLEFITTTGYEAVRVMNQYFVKGDETLGDKVSTTDAATPVYACTIAPADETAIFIEALVVGKKDGAADSANYHFSGLFRRTAAGAPVQVGDTTYYSINETDDTWVGAVFNINVDTIRIQINGKVGTNIDWTPVLKYTYVTD